MNNPYLFLTGVGRVTALAFCFSAAISCVPLPWLEKFNSHPNVEKKAPNSTPATATPIQEPYFVGLALSGGGSRAANFSASVLWELDQLGVLQHVQYISSVSGGSLTGAYYALFKDDREKWKEKTLREVMGQDFTWWGFGYLLNPVRFIKKLGTSYDRTDVMAEVFSNRLLDQKTFGQLPSRPRLLLNATNYITGHPFAFTNEDFDKIQSDLGALQVATGVMASAAFPAGFRNVTLKDFKETELAKTHDVYVHLFDAGVYDNLGILKLLEVHEKQVAALGEDAFAQGCLIIAVDAYTPYFAADAADRPDTRTWEDLLLDTNFLNAFDVFLQTKRRRTLENLGFDKSNLEAAKRESGKERRPVNFIRNMNTTQLVRRAHETDAEYQKREVVQRKRADCRIWHIALTQLDLPKARKPLVDDPEGKKFEGLKELYQADYNARFKSPLGVEYSDFGQAVRTIPTSFSLDQTDLDYLFAAGSILVRERNSRRIICQWLKEVANQQCTPQGTP